MSLHDFFLDGENIDNAQWTWSLSSLLKESICVLCKNLYDNITVNFKAILDWAFIISIKSNIVIKALGIYY